MNPPLSAFVDSDVIVSSLLSLKGAANYIIHQTNIKLYISNISLTELKTVVKRLSLNEELLIDTVRKRFTITDIKLSVPEIKNKYAPYVIDINDAHIISGAVKSKTKFLLTYNLKHFKTDKIKADLNIILAKPATFLQYVRSQ